MGVTLPIEFIGSDGKSTIDRVAGSPCIKVKICNEALQGMEIMACLDTGADFNYVDVDVLHALKVPVLRTMSANREDVSIHSVRIIPVGTEGHMRFEVASRNIRHLGNGFDMLLGRQFLATGRFCFDIRTGNECTFTLGQ